MKKESIYVSELSTALHKFNNYHFCRGNSNRRKTRIGVILKGRGTYIYLNKKLKVNEGDIVFIPENIYCYSEWRGSPEINVLYVSGFMHYEKYWYEPQIISNDKGIKDNLIKISELLSLDFVDELEAYSLFYMLLKKIIPQMQRSNISYDKTLQNAIDFIVENWNSSFSIGDVAKKCCVSESTLYHLFKKELGQTPVHFLNSIKINVAIEYLENSNYSIATISNMVGFNSENHFRKIFNDITGITPLKYRKNN